MQHRSVPCSPLQPASKDSLTIETSSHHHLCSSQIKRNIYSHHTYVWFAEQCPATYRTVPPHWSTVDVLVSRGARGESRYHLHRPISSRGISKTCRGYLLADIGIRRIYGNTFNSAGTCFSPPASHDRWCGLTFQPTADDGASFVNYTDLTAELAAKNARKVTFIWFVLFGLSTQRREIGNAISICQLDGEIL